MTALSDLGYLLLAAFVVGVIAVALNGWIG